MSKCPICEKGLSEPIPPFCSTCGWDLKNDMGLGTFLGEIPQALVQEYRQRLSVARKNRKDQEESERECRELKEKLKSAESRLEEMEHQEKKYKQQLSEAQKNRTNQKEKKKIRELEKKLRASESRLEELERQEKKYKQQLSEAGNNRTDQKEKKKIRELEKKLRESEARLAELQHRGNEPVEIEKNEPRPETAANEQMGRICFLSGGEGEIDLTKKHTKIGKGASSDIMISGLTVGITAAAIIKSQGNYYLSYLGGISKPKINGEPVIKTSILNDFDVIEIGTAKMQFIYQR